MNSWLVFKNTAELMCKCILIFHSHKKMILTHVCVERVFNQCKGMLNIENLSKNDLTERIPCHQKFHLEETQCYKLVINNT